MKAKYLILVLLVMLILSGRNYAQTFTQPCGITFANYIECGVSIDFDYSFEDCGPGPSPPNPGGSCGSTQSVFGLIGPMIIPCDPLCISNGGTCNLYITITAIGGCPITPTTLDWQTAWAAPAGRAFVLLPCPAPGCLPANCCDLGTALHMSTVFGSIYLGVN